MPAGYYTWLRWYLGHAEFKGHARDPRLRPPVPRVIPREWWRRLERRLAASKPRPPQQADGWPTFRQPGVVVQQLDEDPDWLGRTMLTYGYPWATVLVLGDEFIRHDELGSFIKRLRSTGVIVGGWGVQHNIPDPEGDADRADLAIAKYDLAFYIANCEKLYETQFDLSRRFLERFRQWRPMIPLGVSPESNITIDHVRWVAAGAHCFPQTYTTETGDEPFYGYYANTRYHGWPGDRVHDWISVGYGNKPVTAARYTELVNVAQAWGMRGGALYKGELMRAIPAYWTVLL